MGKAFSSGYFASNRTYVITVLPYIELYLKVYSIGVPINEYCYFVVVLKGGILMSPLEALHQAHRFRCNNFEIPV